jgi:hypothetical protein
MASINNIKLAAKKVTGAGDRWEITVSYDAVFSKFEVEHFTFRDGFVLKEEDSLSGDDTLTGVVGVSVFNPPSSPVKRVMKAVIDGDTLDTELGQEELYAVVRLRNLDLNVLHTKKSPILHLSP